MSKEFEEIVLKKLEKLDILDERTKILENDVKDTKQGLKDLSTKVGNLETEVKDTKQGLKDLSTRVGKLEIEVKDTEEVVLDIRQSFTKFDYEINKKIDTLFDANTVSQEKHSSFEENMVSLNAKIFDHDIRISDLEKKVLPA